MLPDLALIEEIFNWRPQIDTLNARREGWVHNDDVMFVSKEELKANFLARIRDKR
jgi:hypothetical protein